MRETWRRVRRLALPVLAGLALTLATSCIESRRLEVQDWDCPPAPASCARPVVVIGWPLPYGSDFLGISPVNSADLVGLLLGEDVFHARAFWLDALLWTAAAALVSRTIRGWRRRPRG